MKLHIKRCYGTGHEGITRCPDCMLVLLRLLWARDKDIPWLIILHCANNTSYFTKFKQDLSW